MCNSNDLLTAYLTIELASFPLYILASFKKKSSFSIDSGIKYFITGAITSSFYLLGSSFIYGFIGSISFSDFHSLSDSFVYTWHFNKCEYFKMISFYNLNFLEWGLSLIIFSLFVKLALAPFHLWSLDVYEVHR